MIILFLYTVSILTLDLMILSFNGFYSYLTDCTHYVSISNHCSAFAQVYLRVQFLALYFSPCTLSLCLPLLTHTIIHHSLADDLQLQMSADRIYELLHSIQSCISDVKSSATANILKLNDNKTELLLVTSKRTRHLHNLPTSITIGNAQIPFKQSVKNLGFTLYCHLIMNAHVSNVAWTCYFELHRLTYIHRILTSIATATLLSAFVCQELTTVTHCCLVILMM